LSTPFSRIAQWAARFNRWFGGAAVAANAETVGMSGRQVDPTTVVAVLGEIERGGRSEEREGERHSD
jgi:hypothetical protein